MATKKREAADRCKNGLEKKVLDLGGQVKELDERLESSLMQLKVCLLGHTLGVTVFVCCLMAYGVWLFAMKASAGYGHLY